MDPSTLFVALLGYLFDKFPNTPWFLILFAWLALAQTARIIQSRFLPPPPGSWRVWPWKFLKLLSCSFGYAQLAYDVGKKAIFVPVGTDRVEAAKAIGYDPQTTSPHYKGMPKPIGTGNEENATEAEVAAKVEGGGNAVEGIASEKAAEQKPTA